MELVRLHSAAAGMNELIAKEPCHFHAESLPAYVLYLKAAHKVTGNLNYFGH